MSRHRYRCVAQALAAPLVVATALAATVLTPSAATATSGSTRYASPSGVTSATCPKSAPCGIVAAINQAASGDVIVIKPGTYAKAAPLTASLTDTSGTLTIHGEVGKPLPVIYSAATTAFDLATSRLSRVEVRATGHTAGIVDSSGTVDHVIAIESAASSVACETDIGLTESLCVDSGANGTAVEVQASTAAKPVSHLHETLYGVTAQATASTGTGVLVSAGALTVLTLRVTNTILHGGHADAVARTTATSGTATLLLKHSDYKTTRDEGTTGAPTVQGDATDIHAKPVFVKPAANNYAEKASSPTINVGSSAPAGDTDVIGHPRWVGRAPDLGAYEFRQAPLIAKLTPTHTTPHSAQLKVQVNAEGLPTKVHVVATLGSHRLTSKTVSAGSGHAVVIVHLRLTGLHATSVYHIQAFASSAGGKAHTQLKTLHTGA